MKILICEGLCIPILRNRMRVIFTRGMMQEKEKKREKRDNTKKTSLTHN